ncbi:LptF/LptG family permease, partial [Candidatus Aerophobetes bacterium]|nr:LptF/LptG family permease [Candidatus Aerophobetes bacterium]
MRILDRYIIKEFLRYYFLFLLFFVAIFVLTDFFTSMSHFKKEADIFQIIFYYLLQIPYLIILLSPLSIIISTLFTLSYFGSTNQLKAIQISGLSLKRATFPIFAAGIII